MSSDLGKNSTDTNVYDMSSVRGRISIKDLPNWEIMAKSTLISRYTSKVTFKHNTGTSLEDVINAMDENRDALMELSKDLVVSTVSSIEGMTSLDNLANAVGIDVCALVLRYELLGGTIEELIGPWYEVTSFAGNTYTDFEFKAKFKFKIREIADFGEGPTVHTKVKSLIKKDFQSEPITPYSKLFLA